MSFSRALRWSLVVLLPLTLGWKVAFYSTDSEEPKRKAEHRAAEFLGRHKFNQISTEELTGEMPVVRGAAGTCRIIIASVSPRGWHQDMLQNLVTPSDQIFFVFNGQVYAQQPKLRTIFDFLWAKFLNQIGLHVYAKPVFAVISTGKCEAERLPWRELG